YYFEAFRVKEIAEILAISEGTVKSRLSRARQELKKALEAAQ
ncbi:MAG: LuxR C-terminal-related transcriptional regulator, partial [Lachnospiraceae bacterium]|nr:LuxR C-terminal-related transcriptional regulator [Lachnospiraceae bacterium]